MAEHSGKDILSSDVEIKGSIKFQKELLIDGKVEGRDQFRWRPDHRRKRRHPRRDQDQIDHGLRQSAGQHHRGRTLRTEVALHAAGRPEGGPSRDRGRRDFHRQVGSDQRQELLQPQPARPEIVRNEEPAAPAKAAFGAAANAVSFRSGAPWPSRPAKVSVECPHCGFKQMEYAAAKSTMCRQCGKHFAPSAPNRHRKPKRSRNPSGRSSERIASWQVRGPLERPRQLRCRVLRVQAKQEVNAAATSTSARRAAPTSTCAITRSPPAFSRAIRTQGEVHRHGKGDLSSSNVICRSALIEGKLRGNLQCTRRPQSISSARFPGG